MSVCVYVCWYMICVYVSMYVYVYIFMFACMYEYIYGRCWFEEDSITDVGTRYNYPSAGQPSCATPLARTPGVWRCAWRRTHQVWRCYADIAEDASIPRHGIMQFLTCWYEDVGIKTCIWNVETYEDGVWKKDTKKGYQRTVLAAYTEEYVYKPAPMPKKLAQTVKPTREIMCMENS